MNAMQMAQPRGLTVTSVRMDDVRVIYGSSCLFNWIDPFGLQNLSQMTRYVCGCESMRVRNDGEWNVVEKTRIFDFVRPMGGMLFGFALLAMPWKKRVNGKTTAGTDRGKKQHAYCPPRTVLSEFG